MQEIADIFTEVQSSTSIPKNMVRILNESYKKNQKQFTYTLEQCFLKILNKLSSIKTPPKKMYENFEKLLEKFLISLYKPEQTKENLSEKDDFKNIYQNFLLFFSFGLENPNMNIKIFCSRILIIMMKIPQKNELELMITHTIGLHLLTGTMILLKQKSSSKQFGIKLASFLQTLPDPGLNSELQFLRNEILKIMCCDENTENRKLSLINLALTDENFSDFIRRTREFQSELRLTIFNRLIKEKVQLASKNITAIYKVVYDGLYSREEIIKKKSIYYLSLIYNDFNQHKSNMELEEETDNQNKNRRFSSFSTPKKFEIMEELREKIIKFFRLFQLNNTLFFPTLYQMMEILAKDFLFKIVSLSDFCAYLREFLLHALVIKEKSQEIKVTSEEIFLIRVLCSLMQESKDESKDLNELFAIIDECFPNGCIFVKIIEYFNSKKDLFGLYQSLLMSEMLINCDEISRAQLIVCLKNLILDGNNFNIEFPNISEESDLFYNMDEEQLRIKINTQSYFEPPIIKEKIDLFPLIVRILRKLIGEDGPTFATNIVEIISEIREPLSEDSDEYLDNKKSTLLKKISFLMQKIEEISPEIKKNKKKLPKNDESLKSYAQLKSDHLSLTEKLKNIDAKIDSINNQCLNLTIGLLQSNKLTLKEQSIESLLTNFIGPLFRSENQLIKDKALQTLALYVMLDKKTCLEYFKVFYQIFENEEFLKNNLNSTDIISTKAIFDFFMIYNLGQENLRESQLEENNFDSDLVIEKLLKMLYKSPSILQTICIEGLCRLLFNGKLKENEGILSNLILLWHSPNLMKNGSGESIQILSIFFTNFTEEQSKKLEDFEKSVEMIVHLAVMLQAKGLKLDPEFIAIDLSDSNKFYHFLKVCVLLMKKAKIDWENVEITSLFSFIFFFIVTILNDNHSLPFPIIFDKLLIDIGFLSDLPLHQLILLRNLFNKLNNDSEYAKLKSIKIWLQNIETKLVDCENFNELEIKADELNTIMLSEISDRKLKIITFYKTLEQNQLIIQKPIENIETQSQTSEKVSKLGKKRKIATFEGENEENQEIVPQVGKSKRKK